MINQLTYRSEKQITIKNQSRYYENFLNSLKLEKRKLIKYGKIFKQQLVRQYIIDQHLLHYYKYKKVKSSESRIVNLLQCQFQQIANFAKNISQKCIKIVAVDCQQSPIWIYANSDQEYDLLLKYIIYLSQKRAIDKLDKQEVLAYFLNKETMSTCFDMCASIKKPTMIIDNCIAKKRESNNNIINNQSITMQNNSQQIILIPQPDRQIEQKSIVAFNNNNQNTIRSQQPLSPRQSEFSENDNVSLWNDESVQGNNNLSLSQAIFNMHIMMKPTISQMAVQSLKTKQVSKHFTSLQSSPRDPTLALETGSNQDTNFQWKNNQQQPFFLQQGNECKINGLCKNRSQALLAKLEYNNIQDYENNEEFNQQNTDHQENIEQEEEVNIKDMHTQKFYAKSDKDFVELFLEQVQKEGKNTHRQNLIMMTQNQFDYQSVRIESEMDQVGYNIKDGSFQQFNQLENSQEYQFNFEIQISERTSNRVSEMMQKYNSLQLNQQNIIYIQKSLKSLHDTLEYQDNEGGLPGTEKQLQFSIQEQSLGDIQIPDSQYQRKNVPISSIYCDVQQHCLPLQQNPQQYQQQQQYQNNLEKQVSIISNFNLQSSRTLKSVKDLQSNASNSSAKDINNVNNNACNNTNQKAVSRKLQTDTKLPLNIAQQRSNDKYNPQQSLNHSNNNEPHTKNSSDLTQQQDQPGLLRSATNLSTHAKAQKSNIETKQQQQQQQQQQQGLNNNSSEKVLMQQGSSVTQQSRLFEKYLQSNNSVLDQSQQQIEDTPVLSPELDMQGEYRIVQKAVELIWNFQFERGIEKLNLIRQRNINIELIIIDVYYLQIITMGKKNLIVECEDHLQEFLNYLNNLIKSKAVPFISPQHNSHEYPPTNTNTSLLATSISQLEPISQNDIDLIKSEVYTCKGLFSALQNNKFQAFFAFRNAWQYYCNIQNQINEKTLSVNQLSLYSQSRYYFLTGMFYIGLSMIPNFFQKILNILGIQQNKELGHNALVLCIDLNHFRSHFAALLLSIEYLELNPDLDQAVFIVKKQIKKLPKCPIFYWLASLLNWRYCLASEACQLIKKSLKLCGKKIEPQAYFFQFEYGWFHLSLFQWEQALEIFLKIALVSLNLQEFDIHLYKSLCVSKNLDPKLHSQFSIFIKQCEDYPEQESILLPHKCSIAILISICYIGLNQAELAKTWLIMCLYLLKKNSDTASLVDQELAKLASKYVKLNNMNFVPFEVLYFVKEICKLNDEKLQFMQQQLSKYQTSPDHLSILQQCKSSNFKQSVAIIDSQLQEKLIVFCSVNFLLIVNGCLLQKYNIVYQAGKNLDQVECLIPSNYHYLLHHSYHWVARCYMLEYKFELTREYIKKCLQFKSCEFSLEIKSKKIISDLKSL